MKTLLSYACCLLAIAPTALAYEVSSFSTASSPTFIKTADGSADLTYPVASGNTFGSPDWYEELERVCFPMKWKIVRSDGVVATNNHENYEVADCGDYEFATWPTITWNWSDEPSLPKGQDLSPWFMYQDMGPYGVEYTILNAMFPDSLSSFNNRIEYPCPYPFMEALETYVVPLHDPSGPGTIEFRMTYDIGSPTNVDNKTVSVTMFPVEYEGNYWRTKGDELYGVDTEIWLPKFQRLTPASRSALIAAYEAYFERMYYGSKGVTDDGEDEDEWELWQLGAPDADADFVIRSPMWSPYTPEGSGFLDAFHYPESAYYDPTNSPSARRHYPSSCFRLMDESTNVARLAYSMRQLSPFTVQSGWLGHGAIPDEPLRNETPFLVRPQWLLDGRMVPGHYTAANCGYSYLWWSSQVDPPAVEQELAPGSPSEGKYIPDFSVFPEITSPQYYAEDGVTDSYIPYHDGDLGKNIRPAQYAFTFSDLLPDDVFRYLYVGYSPMKAVFNMLEDAVGQRFNDAVSRLGSYDPHGLTVPGFVTNCVRQAARSLPLRSDAMDAYSVRLAETSETFRVDSGPIAAASHILGLMDRTIHIPFQEFVCTNWTVEGRSGGYYRGALSQGDATNVIELTDIAHSESLFEWGMVPNGKPTSFTVRNTRTNAVEECVDHHETKSVDSSIRMFARSPSDVPEPGELPGVSVYEENLPYKSFKVGTDVVGSTPSSPPIEDGDWAVGGPVSWLGPAEFPQIGSGPHVTLYPKDESKLRTQTFVFTHYPSNDIPRIIINKGPAHDVLALSRGYTFCDKDSVECGMTLGPVQAGVDPDKGDASHYAGILLGGAVDSTDEHGKSRQYDFTSAFKTDVTSRSGLLSWIDGKAGNLSTTLSDRIKDASRCGLRDPRKPGEYAPMPEWYEQKATVVGDELEDHVLALKVDAESIRLTKEETFPEGTADKYVFDVETWVSSAGYVDYVCETGRSVTVVGEVDEYWHLVDYYADVWNLDHAVTNITRNEDSGWSGYTYKVRDETILSTITTEVARVVMSGDTNLLTAVRTVSTNVTHTTAFDSSESYQSEFNVTVWRKDPTFGYYYEYDTRRDTDSGNRPWPIPPIVNKAVTNSTVTVELNPADAKSHETVQVGGTYTYTPVISVSDGKVVRISFESPDPDAPSIPDTEEFIVANETVEGDVLNNWAKSWFEYSEVTNNAPTNAVWTGSFDGAARPAVMTWTDWTWNALKRD